MNSAPCSLTVNSAPCSLTLCSPLSKTIFRLEALSVVLDTQKTVLAAVINSSSSTSVTTRAGVLALKASKKF